MAQQHRVDDALAVKSPLHIVLVAMQEAPQAVPATRSAGTLQAHEVKSCIDDSSHLLKVGQDSTGKDVFIRYCVLGGSVPENGCGAAALILLIRTLHWPCCAC